ncbi:hypothetical protein IFM47457_10167 [Aspergillus lentulus]|nr:hypothetical protein IFM47457_10167 [Aspergillus lentulus]
MPFVWKVCVSQMRSTRQMRFWDELAGSHETVTNGAQVLACCDGHIAHADGRNDNKTVAVGVDGLNGDLIFE